MVGLILVTLHPELGVKSQGAGTQKIEGVSIKTMLVMSKVRVRVGAKHLPTLTFCAYELDS
jgi:hypothetical protein